MSNHVNFEGCSRNAVLASKPAGGNHGSASLNMQEAPLGSGVIQFLGDKINQLTSSRPMDTELEDISHRVVKISSPTTKTESNIGDYDACQEYDYAGEDQQAKSEKGIIAEHLMPLIDAAFPGTSAALGVDVSVAFEEEIEDKNIRTYILGKTYHPIHDYTVRRDDESMLFWFTYRAEFNEIKPYAIRSDAGWGCMLRATQMMMAQALRVHFKSRHWKPPKSLSSRRKDPFVRSMLTWFADFASSSEHFYSLHNMVASGLANYDKLPGEWYGPGTACYVLRDLAEIHSKHMAKTMFRVHVTGSVYTEQVHDLMTRDAKAIMKAKEGERRIPPASHPLELPEPLGAQEAADELEWDTALLLLIPLRLGLKSFNSDYIEAVSYTFSLKQSVGVLGGRPRGARWFYGALSDGSKIFGLDPHTVQPAPRKRPAAVNGKSSLVVDLSNDYLRSVHTANAEVFSLQQMDPSIALGFYCQNRRDFDEVINAMRSWNASHSNMPELFPIAAKPPNYEVDLGGAMNDLMLDSLLDDDEQELSDEDEYVML